jgi:hypothetical protein
MNPAKTLKRYPNALWKNAVLWKNADPDIPILIAGKSA